MQGDSFTVLYLHCWKVKKTCILPRSMIIHGWIYTYLWISRVPVDLPGHRLLSFLALNSRIRAKLGNCWPLSATCTVDSFPSALPLKSWSQVRWSYSGAWEQVTASLEMAKPANQVSLKGWLTQEEEHFQASQSSMSSGVLRYNNKYFL